MTTEKSNSHGNVQVNPSLVVENLIARLDGMPPMITVPVLADVLAVTIFQAGVGADMRKALAKLAHEHVRSELKKMERRSRKMEAGNG